MSEIKVGEEIDGVPVRVGQVHIRPIYQLLKMDVDDEYPWEMMDDAARWPVPIRHQDLTVWDQAR